VYATVDCLLIALVELEALVMIVKPGLAVDDFREELG